MCQTMSSIPVLALVMPAVSGCMAHELALMPRLDHSTTNKARFVARMGASENQGPRISPQRGEDARKRAYGSCRYRVDPRLRGNERSFCRALGSVLDCQR